MTIDQLKRISPYVSVQRICKKAGLSGDAIRARVRRGSGLTPNQSKRLDEALEEIGLSVDSAETKEIVDEVQSATGHTQV